MISFPSFHRPPAREGSVLLPGPNYSPESTAFRFFCPRAAAVEVVLRPSLLSVSGLLTIPMTSAGSGWWECSVKGQFNGHYYGYRIHSGDSHAADQPLTEHVVADPWARYWTVENSYLQRPWSKIVRPAPFDWENDTFLAPVDPRDLIIYETHIKDLVAHPSACNAFSGTEVYKTFLEKGQKGGIEHLKTLGVNAVEFLPLQQFAYFEPPYLEATPDGVLNTWNFYGRNYWGYMTSSYFVPEMRYASGASLTPDIRIDNAERAVKEVKELVKGLHKAGIAVIVDVVYNHVSQYDLNPLKYSDINYFLRRNRDGYFTSDSGCGNDLKTEAPETRRLIVESLRYWMTEFHVDGFRFDLAKILDWETVESIKDELRSINPYVVLIAEPWGGGYDPQGFSYHDWAAWNDQIRNGVKGSDPHSDKGFIFGSWHHGTTRFALENYLTGTLTGKDGGRFIRSRHTVNYLESHDNYTLADFIRLGLDPERGKRKVSDWKMHQTLNEVELKLSKLAAFYLFVSQGITMIHAGQEMGRGKVIASSGINDSGTGNIDHNSYEKDNETNWLDFSLLEINKPLLDYYRGLIRIRKESPALRRSSPGSIRFRTAPDALFIDETVSGEESGDRRDYRILLNGNIFKSFSIHVDADWELLVDGNSVRLLPEKITSAELTVPPQTPLLLVRTRKFPN